jgi:hypothetical protein
MTVSVSLAFPGSRILSGWWKRLSALQPRACWLAHLFLHRVEASVLLERTFHLDPLPLFVLKALALDSHENLQRLDDQLRLGRPLLAQLLRQLQHRRLIEANGAETWSLTALGAKAVAERTYAQLHPERRTFAFVEPERFEGTAYFLNVRDHAPASAWPESDGYRFDVRTLRACIAQPMEWKEWSGFPCDVQAVVDGETPDPACESLSAWQRVVVDRPEHLLTVLALTPGQDGEQLLGFAIEPDGWHLDMDTPVFALHSPTQQRLPELMADPSPEQWRQAWQAWCQPRALPPAEVNACVLERRDYRLLVQAPARLVERLRAARSDVFKREAWLLAGAGRTRMAARIELAEPAKS